MGGRGPCEDREGRSDMIPAGKWPTETVPGWRRALNEE